jgi:predicted nuclease with TOPRIM domain
VSAAAWQFLGTLATAGLAFFGIWLSVRQSGQKTKTDAAQGLFNELQEERAELKKDRSELHAQVQALREEVAVLRRENFELMDFVQDLRNHIREGLGPPPPDWPQALHGA